MLKKIYSLLRKKIDFEYDMGSMLNNMLRKKNEKQKYLSCLLCAIINGKGVRKYMKKKKNLNRIIQ